MLTAYDYPDRQAPRRGRHPAAARRRFARPGHPRLRDDGPGDDGRDGPPHEGRGPRHVAGAGRRRHAVPLLLDARRGARERRASSCARPAPRRSRSRAACGRPAIDRGARPRRHPGDGPHRPDAAVDQQRRQGPRPGQDPRPGACAARRRAGGPGGRRLRDGPRARPGAARGGDHRAPPHPDDRDRRRRRLQRPGPGHHRPASASATSCPKHARPYADVRETIRDAAERLRGRRRRRHLPGSGRDRPDGRRRSSTRSSVAARRTGRPARSRRAASRSTATSERRRRPA